MRQIIDFRYGKRWDVRMEGVMAQHGALAGNQDIADVAWYVSKLERDGARGVGDGQYVERGAALYAKSCASCHGVKAEGDEARGIPRLSGQHAAYLTRQIYDAVDARRLPLAASHRKRLVTLDFEEVLGLTDYLSRIGWNPPVESTALDESTPGSYRRLPASYRIHGEPEPFGELHHALVVGEYGAVNRAEALLRGVGEQQWNQRAADTAALPRVRHRHGEFTRVRCRPRRNARHRRCARRLPGR